MDRRWCDFCETDTEHDEDGFCVECYMDAEEDKAETPEEDEPEDEAP